MSSDLPEGRAVLIKLLERVSVADEGATATEYAIVASLIAVVVAASVGLVGGAVRGYFEAAVAAFQ